MRYYIYFKTSFHEIFVEVVWNGTSANPTHPWPYLYIEHLYIKHWRHDLNTNVTFYTTL